MMSKIEREALVECIEERPHARKGVQGIWSLEQGVGENRIVLECVAYLVEVTGELDLLLLSYLTNVG
jgi:hypothetical protein